MTPIDPVFQAFLRVLHIPFCGRSGVLPMSQTDVTRGMRMLCDMIAVVRQNETAQLQLCRALLIPSITPNFPYRDTGINNNLTMASPCHMDIHVQRFAIKALCFPLSLF